MPELAVYYETRRVGTIEVGADGPSFAYDQAWLTTRGAFPVSVLMPLSAQPVPSQIFLPWASNLLPEGAQLRAIGHTLGASPEDVIGILREIGRDTAGALSIGQPGSTSPGDWRPIGSPENLERIINELPRKPFLAGEDGVSMSLAGVQSKIGVAVDGEGQLCIPVDGAPSTHILKPDSTQLYGSVQNEALCMVLARRCRLNVPVVTTGAAGARSYLLVNRYDRIEQDGRWRRLHQEDFCQALGKPPSAKYEANQTGIRGPTLADMFALTRAAMQAPDIIRLLDQAVFNVLACNTDAHAKNYSLLLGSRGAKLAPLYDVMCADAWDGITRNLAQKIAGKNRGEHLKRRHWERFAEDCGLNPARVVGRVASLSRLVLREAASAEDAVAAMPAGGHGLLPAFREAIERRARAVLAGLEDGSASEGDANT
ncbi:type II toxin-antitoxin system HipA family toxin [Rhodomicrobium sp. Az07]|uniref:type II toxin-antitoxin system HipA family toxin n=1 Tax=Rhodomicrobium sp. Az07 TaxID=2839034 RepID=UPI0035304E49